MLFLTPSEEKDVREFSLRIKNTLNKDLSDLN